MLEKLVSTVTPVYLLGVYAFLPKDQRVVLEKLNQRPAKGRSNKSRSIRPFIPLCEHDVSRVPVKHSLKTSDGEQWKRSSTEADCPLAFFGVIDGTGRCKRHCQC